MNIELEEAWKQSLPPFAEDYKTIYFATAEIESSRQYLLSVAKHIKAYFPEQRLFTLHDWHFHDGFNTKGKEIRELNELFETPSEFLKTSTGDFQVYVSVYPENMEFLLRWCIEEEDGEIGFDFTGKPIDLLELRKRKNDFDLPDFKELDAISYFTENYAG